MGVETVRLRLTGVRPLLHHSARLADPLDPATIELTRLVHKVGRDKTPADHAEIGRLEWYGGMWTHDERPCVPGEAIESCFIGAARTRRRGKAAQAGFFCEESPLLIYDGPQNLAGLWADPRYRFRYPVRVNNARTIRTRPRFPEWSLDLTAEYVPTVLSRPEILEIFEIAGFREGLGDWRPKFGRFSVMVLD